MAYGFVLNLRENRQSIEGFSWPKKDYIIGALVLIRRTPSFANRTGTVIFVKRKNSTVLSSQNRKNLMHITKLSGSTNKVLGKYLQKVQMLNQTRTGNPPMSPLTA